MATMATAPSPSSSLSFFSSSVFLPSSSKPFSVSVLKRQSLKTPAPLSTTVSAQLATLSVFNFEGEKVGQTFLNLKTAPLETARAVVHRALTTDLTNKRSGTASKLTRAEANLLPGQAGANLLPGQMWISPSHFLFSSRISSRSLPPLLLVLIPLILCSHSGFVPDSAPRAGLPLLSAPAPSYSLILSGRRASEEWMLATTVASLLVKLSVSGRVKEDSRLAAIVGQIQEAVSRGSLSCTKATRTG